MSGKRKGLWGAREMDMDTLEMEKQALENPVADEAKKNEAVRKLFSHYLNHGQGDELRQLVQTLPSLGVDLDTFQALTYRFMIGDFTWIVQSDQIPFWDRAGHLLFIYSYTRSNPEKTLY